MGFYHKSGSHKSGFDCIPIYIELLLKYDVDRHNENFLFLPKKEEFYCKFIKGVVKFNNKVKEILRESSKLFTMRWTVQHRIALQPS